MSSAPGPSELGARPPSALAGLFFRQPLGELPLHEGASWERDADEFKKRWKRSAVAFQLRNQTYPLLQHPGEAAGRSLVRAFASVPLLWPASSYLSLRA